jgi:hypothetical protein
MFPLSLSVTAFTWFTSLAPNSIFTWVQLEQKFHEYFYYGDTELRLSYLIVVKQKHNEPVAEYIWRFRDTRNRCFNLNISDKDLTDLAYSGLTQPKSLGASLGLVISLGMRVTLTRSSIIASRRTTKKMTCA